MKKKTIKYLLGFVLALWASALSAQTHWSVNPSDFEKDMTVYYELQISGVAVPFADLGNYEVAAFVGNECRGIGEILTLNVNDETAVHYGYMRIRSNAENGETISFKAYIKDADQEVFIDEDANILFESNQVVDYPSSPKALNVSKVQLTLIADEAKGTVQGAGSYYRGTQVTATATPATGYAFTKWSDESVDNPYVITMNESKTLSVVFAPISYNLKCDLAGGVVATANPTTYTIESEDITLNNPTREGYVFDGWSGTGISDNTPTVTIYKGSTGNRSYVALWKPAVYNIIYMVKGVEWARDEVDYGTPIVLRDYIPEGEEIFNGWESDQEYTTMPAHDIIYTANLSFNPTGIQKIMKNADDADVFTTTGLMVGRKMSATEIMQLNKGVYVVNGMKIVIK